MKITAVVVTFNRFELLKKTIQSLRNQTIKLDSIIVVNNGSTDGTRAWLDNEKGLSVINQENIGGSGGFYTGIKYAHEHGFDWMWCMDDDVFPTPECLENLLKKDSEGIGILCPRRKMNGKVVINEVVGLNLSNPFKKIHGKPLKEENLSGRGTANIVGMVFEGPLIKKEVVDKIGYPNKDLFLFYDDTDYSYRATLAGYKVVYVKDAILDKQYFAANKTREQLVQSGKWKLKYHLRNTTYFCHEYGKNFIFRRFGATPLFIHMFLAIAFNLPLNKKYTFKDFSMLFDMYKRGIKGYLGKID